ncbi:MAG: NUDIX hydrolase [Bacteroidota bacterium]|nr:NUDIX hydrolase [Bacteroidota bacterium]
MILKSFVLIEKAGRYLLIKEAAKKWNGKWFLPGGKVELNESPENAAHREAKEEAGCDIVINGMFYFRYNYGFLDDYLAIFYSASIFGEEKLKTVADKHSLEVKWFTYDEIVKLPLRQKLLDIINNYQKENILPASNFKII